MSSDNDQGICNPDDIQIPEPTSEESKEIQQINKETIHRICSGQVVISLAIAVKELVENSLDAGASVIEVKLKQYGLESIEVSDNGCGVEENNIKGMTAKYHTSKIKEFSDLSEVATFGFRGEALSSLCALSNMKITTKHKLAQIGLTIELDSEGNITNKSMCPREIGTTVTLTNLFSTLPVRKREFEKNVKKEFTKMCQILQAYSIVSKGVKIICSNIDEKGRKTTFLSTQGSKSILDNISAIFGSKQISDLIEIKPPLMQGQKFSEDSFTELEDVSNSSLQINNEDIERLNNIDFNIEGWISSCSHGNGRSSKDRQYFFINSRPCDNKNISKLVNEIYHRYNVNQYPFIFLNLVMKRSDVDVNVTPDKRQLYLNNLKIVLLAIKKSLVNTFGHIPSTFKIQNSTLFDFQIDKNYPVDNTVKEEIQTIQIPNSKSFMEKLMQFKQNDSMTGVPKRVTTKRKSATDEIEERTKKLKKIHMFLSQQPTLPEIKESFASYKSDDSEDEIKDKSINISVNLNSLQQESKEFDNLLKSTKEISTDANRVNETDYNLTANETSQEVVTQIICRNIPKQSDDECLLKTINFEDSNSENDLQNSQSSATLSQDSVIVVENKSITIELDECDSIDCKINIIPANIIETSIEEIRKLAIDEDKYTQLVEIKPNISRLKFKSEINPNKNKKAEEELDKEITQDMFSKMEIIGQFNLGFIIVKLDDDLFIIDQHATDEKYNFENLQKTVVLQSQTLTVPERLELTAIDEMILIDNIKIFEANGFKISIDDEAKPTKKLKLIAKPFSKNWQFGREDISDLLFMLQDAPPDAMVRPSKVRSMFASRACRKSIMIGQTLNKTTMKRLVNNMGEIEHPWNCPHGRPTMRHLINLAMLQTDNSDNSDNET